MTLTLVRWPRRVATALALMTLTLLAQPVAAQTTSYTPACVPGLFGTTLDVAAPKRYDAGWRLLWLCEVDGKPRPEWLVCVHGVCIESLMRNTYVAASTAADSRAAIAAAYAQHATSRCSTATGALATMCGIARADAAALLASYQARQPAPPQPPPPPPAPRWVVAENPSSTTTPPSRPTRFWPYVLTLTGAPRQAPERVVVGEPCDPMVGAGDYRGVLGRQDRVALCKQQ